MNRLIRFILILMLLAGLLLGLIYNLTWRPVPREEML